MIRPHLHSLICTLSHIPSLPILHPPHQSFVVVVVVVDDDVVHVDVVFCSRATHDPKLRPQTFSTRDPDSTMMSIIVSLSQRNDAERTNEDTVPVFERDSSE